MRAACLFAGLVCALPGQDPTHRTVAGRVVDLQGAVVPKAKITLVHRPIGWCREYGDPDIVKVTADVKGLFRAKLLPERPYSAYATWGTATAPVVSAPLEHVTAGSFITLSRPQPVEQSVSVLQPHLAGNPLDNRRPGFPRVPLDSRATMDRDPR